MYVKRTLILMAAVAALGAATAATVTPVNHSEPLANPDMGLVQYHYSNRQWAYGQMLERGDVLDWFPGTSCVYFRLPWCLLEPEEGKYRWDIIDSYARPWIAAGRQIGLRVTCCESRYTYATPEWVRAAGARGWLFRMPAMHKVDGRDPAEGGPELWEPDYGDPVFLAKLENFLRAMARRYDGRPYVAFVDVGTIGMWGEGHTRAYHPELKKEGRDPEAAFHLHYELFRKCFPRTTVLAIDDQAGASNPEPDAPLMRHARELGFGFRDDSIMVDPPPRSWKHAAWARLFAPDTPVFVETEHYNLSVPRGAWTDDLLVRSVEDNRASWLSLHGWPRELFEKERDGFRRAALRLGYRFELRRAEFPDAVRLGEPVKIRSTWVNVGVARRYRGAFLTWTLLDGRGRVAWSSTDESYDFAAALPELGGVEHPVELETTVTFGAPGRIPQFNDGLLLCMQKLDVNGYGTSDAIPTLEPGRYTLAVSLGDAAGVPTLNLPLPGGRDRLYPVGAVEVGR